VNLTEMKLNADTRRTSVSKDIIVIATMENKSVAVRSVIDARPSILPRSVSAAGCVYIAGGVAPAAISAECPGFFGKTRPSKNCVFHADCAIFFSPGPGTKTDFSLCFLSSSSELCRRECCSSSERWISRCQNNSSTTLMTEICIFGIRRYL